MKLIDKDAVVAKIDEIVSVLQENCNPNPMGNMQECLAAAEIEAINLIKDFIDTLEVKEVQEPTAADRSVVEEIIISLKQIENDYRIDHTREMEWLRSKTQKGIYK